MRRTTIPLLAVALYALTAFSPHTDEPLPLGAALPGGDIKLKDISGKEVTLKSSMKENGLLVMFSCNTCPWVIRNQGRTREICKYALENKVGVILLNSNEGSRDDGDSYQSMQEYARDQGYAWYYAIDKNNELADAFGANRTPECFLFDKSGKLVYHGAIDDNPADAASVGRKHLKEAVNEITQGKEVSVKQSRSVGCNIKRI